MLAKVAKRKKLEYPPLDDEGQIIADEAWWQEMQKLKLKLSTPLLIVFPVQNTAQWLTYCYVNHFLELSMSAQMLSAVPLTSLSGVGAKVAEKLAKVGLHSVQDLLFHLPLRYEDRTRIYPIAKLHAGLWAAVQGKVMTVDTILVNAKC